MTPLEFKAWFEGFTEAMDGEPTPDQWKKVKRRVSEIDGHPVTYPTFVERYWPRFDEPVYPWRYTILCGNGDDLSKFNSCQAMYASGQAEYAS
ncbi:MAG TPA: hypothetical protein VKA31_00400 [Mariprofundaceae bacterium]|nr:hypothetical protein [Mariprofundaceae bacterium]